ncbi:hypothetical protein WAI56_22030, partial [Acinetobacter baumannii]
EITQNKRFSRVETVANRYRSYGNRAVCRPGKRSAAGQQTSGIVRVLLPGNGKYARAICKPMPGRLLNVLR